MNRINYIKHCTSFENVLDILDSGYLLPFTQTDKYITEYKDKLFVQIVFHGARSGSYYDICFKLDKSLLENRKDYYINSWFNYGKVDELTVSLEELSEEVPYRNEVVFSHPISLRKYLLAVVIDVCIDDPATYRFDIIYEAPLRGGLDWYLNYMEERYNKHSKESLTLAYRDAGSLFYNILNYTYLEFNLKSAANDCRLFGFE